jgi:hypothetical protein
MSTEMLEISMVLAETGKDVSNPRPPSSTPDQLRSHIGGGRRPSATVYASELRTMLPPHERWMVAAFGE